MKLGILSIEKGSGLLPEVHRVYSRPLFEVKPKEYEKTMEEALNYE